jgi:hypothetical protein
MNKVMFYLKELSIMKFRNARYKTSSNNKKGKEFPLQACGAQRVMGGLGFRDIGT